MTRFIVAVSLVVLFLMANSPVPARATDADDGLHLISSGGGIGNMWLAIKVPAGNQYFVIDIVQEGVQAINAQGNLVYDEQGDLLGVFALAMTPDDVTIETDGEHIPSIQRDFLPFRPVTSTVQIKIGCPTCPPRAEPMTIVEFGAGQTGPWSFTIHSNETTPAPIEYDTSAFFYRARHFNGTLAAHVSPFIQTRANLDTSLTIHSNDTLIGFYHDETAMTNPLVMSVETPSHGNVSCPCYFYDHAAGPQSWGPGDYTFHLTDVDVDTEIMLYGASIRLPA